jgi:hypothetical protein
MRVTGKTVSMEQTQIKHTLQRRSFFSRLFSGVVGGWIAGSLFLDILRPKRIAQSDEQIRITINPLAVPRLNQDGKSHGA